MQQRARVRAKRSEICVVDLPSRGLLSCQQVWDRGVLSLRAGIKKAHGVLDWDSVDY